MGCGNGHSVRFHAPVGRIVICDPIDSLLIEEVTIIQGGYIKILSLETKDWQNSKL